jgi:dienelactone hydrolase
MLAAAARGNYGANDGWIQRPDVERLAANLKKSGKPGEVKICEGCDHSFFNDMRQDVYGPAAARDAWQHTLQLFAENLPG